jgi:hypothetical protein
MEARQKGLAEQIKGTTGRHGGLDKTGLLMEGTATQFALGPLDTKDGRM